MSENRVCCNCRHNIRTNSLEYAMASCHCEIDGHYIGYVECMTYKCKNWSEDLHGMRFGRLTVLTVASIKEYEGKNGHITRKVKWKCMCDCGKVTTVEQSLLKSGSVKSCGCLRTDSNRIRFKTHGETKTRLYRIWQGMKDRCYSERSTSYKWYGALGVQVCDEWKNSYESFRAWAIKSGYENDLSLDRINPYGNYEPTNCRWATSSEQAHNKRKESKRQYKTRNVICVETQKVYPSGMDASKELGIDWSSIYKACKGERKTVGGYTWKYVDEL